MYTSSYVATEVGLFCQCERLVVLCRMLGALCATRIFFRYGYFTHRSVFSYLPHHLDLASEDSVGHSTCMSVLARRRAIMGSIVQPKRSCLGAATGTAESLHRWGKLPYLPHRQELTLTLTLTLTLSLTHQPPHDSPATRQHTHACTVTNRVF